MFRHAIVLTVCALAGCGGKGKGPAQPGGPPGPPSDVTAVIEGNPARFVVRIALFEGNKVLVDVPAAVDRYDSVTADASEVQGSEGRVIVAQKLSEVGEDEFSRDVEIWVIDAARGDVIWTGRGSYANSFGECETLDVPEVSLENGELVIRVVKGVEKLEPDSTRCESVPLERNEIVRITLR